MTAISFSPNAVPRGPVRIAALLEIPGVAIGLRPIRDLVVAVLIALAACTVVYADERLQDWIPDVLSMPEDAEVVMDREIGSSVRMFSISTGADVDELLADWENSLSANGYPILRGEGEILAQSIEFSGPGIANAKIIVAPGTEDGRNVIEFDATLN